MPPKKGSSKGKGAGKSQTKPASIKVANKRKNKLTKRNSALEKVKQNQLKAMMEQKRANRALQKPGGGLDYSKMKQAPAKKKKPAVQQEPEPGAEVFFGAEDKIKGVEFFGKGDLEKYLTLPSKEEIQKNKKRKQERKPQSRQREEEDEANEDDSSEEDEEVNEYERRARPAMQENRVMPVRSADGKWVARVVPTEKKKEEENEDEENEDAEAEDGEGASDSEGYYENEGDEGDEEPEATEGKAGARRKKAAPLAGELEAKRQERLARFKGDIAEICGGILQDPEHKLGTIDLLHKMCSDSDQEVALLAQLSQAEVLGDLIPMYRIRLPTAEELKQQATKEVAAARAYEAKFLTSYTRFVSFLIDENKRLFYSRKQNHGRAEQTPMDIAVCNSLSTLLQKGYHFNCRKEIITSLTPLLNSPFQPVRETTRKCCSFVFKNDTAGDCTLEMVRIIARMSNQKGSSKLKQEVFQCLLDLPLSAQITGAVIEKKAEKQSKKERKRLSKQGDKTLEKDLKESEATVSVAHRKAVQTALLTEVFTIYFRILKNHPNSNVLPIVLQGVAKFALLINVELLLDLLELLKHLAGTAKSLSVESKLRCVLTSLACLEGKGATVDIDLKEFNQNLYTLLFDLLTLSEQRHTSLLLQSLALMLQKSMQLSLGRVASFMKRIGGLALFMPVGSQMALMHVMRYSFNRYPKLKQLLDGQSCTPGVYQPELADPEHANAFASTAWELPLLTTSHHPEVRKYAGCLVRDEEVGVSLAAKTVQQVHQLFDVSQGGFNPPVEIPESLKHKTMNKGQRLKRKLYLANAAREESESPFIQHLKRKRADT